MRRGRHREALIVDPETHPRRKVCLRVAAAFLGMGERAVRARIEDGDIDAMVNGKSYRIDVNALVAYRERLRFVSRENLSAINR
jgi:hypothetical protein